MKQCDAKSGSTRNGSGRLERETDVTDVTDADVTFRPFRFVRYGKPRSESGYDVSYFHRPRLSLSPRSSPSMSSAASPAYSLRSMSPHAVQAMAAKQASRRVLRSARSRASDEDNDDVNSLKDFEFAVPAVPVRKAKTAGGNARVATPLPKSPAKSPAARSAGNPAAYARLTRAATAAAAAVSKPPTLVPLVAYGDDSEEENMGQESPREPEQPRSAPARRHDPRRHEEGADDHLMAVQALLKRAAAAAKATRVDKSAPRVEEPEVEPEVEHKVEKKTKDVVVVEESVQCGGTTLTGERCKRFTKAKSGFCYNHDEASTVRCMGVTQRGVRCRNHVATDGGKHCGIHAPARVAAREAKAAEPVERCTAITQAGGQCKRFGAGGRCFQH